MWRSHFPSYFYVFAVQCVDITGVIVGLDQRYDRDISGFLTGIYMTEREN